MTDIITTPLIILVIALLYIVGSILVSRFVISGGKTSQEIIDSNKTKITRFLKKYPEADLKKGRTFILAFGFIFAFMSSIYAFSIIGEVQNNIVFDNLEIDSAAIIQIQPPLYTKEVDIQHKDVPAPPPDHDPVVLVIEDNLSEVKQTIKVPVIDNKKDEDFTPPIEKEFVEPDPFIVVAHMPRFKGCEGLNEDEANDCTRRAFQNFLNKTPYSKEALARDIEGTVYVSFVIDEKGEVTDIEIIQSKEKVFNKEVLKHMKKLPTFASPGKQRGKKVKVKYKTSIKFKLG